MLMEAHRTAVNEVQGGFNGAWQHAMALKVADNEGRLLGMNYAIHENVAHHAKQWGLMRWLRGGYYTDLDSAYLRECARLRDEREKFVAEMAQAPTLRGIGLSDAGKPIYWYSVPHKLLPQSVAVTHDAAELLKPLLMRIKARLHETHRVPNAVANPFPATWGLMTLSTEPSWGVTLVLGRPTKDGKAFDYSMSPAATFLKGAAA